MGGCCLISSACPVSQPSQLRVNTKAAFCEADFAFARHVFTAKHDKPLALYWSWRAFVTLLQVW